MTLDRTISNEILRFYIDLKQTFSLTKKQLGAAVWDQTVNQGLFLVLNVAVRGAYPDAVAGRKTPLAETVSGVRMGVEYVAVWST